MKKTKLFLFSLCIITTFTINKVKAQANVSVTAHASAEVIESIGANEIVQLNFGRFSPGAVGGEIRLTPDGTRISTGTVTLNTGTYTAAQFDLSGQPEASVNLTMPSLPVLLVNGSTGKSMEVNSWKSNPADNGRIVLIKGKIAINIGATLKVGNIAENPIGIYTGTYALTFSYN